jgi:hypothetical protein
MQCPGSPGAGQKFGSDDALAQWAQAVLAGAPDRADVVRDPGPARLRPARRQELPPPLVRACCARGCTPVPRPSGRVSVLPVLTS